MSRGFQPQFWQAVKQGAEQQAEKEGVRITFEGPTDETQVEEQMTMLANALAKQPAAIGFAALDSEAAAPVLEQAAIVSGVMTWAITQNPVGMGEELVKAAVAALDGDELPESIDTGYFWYDQSNLEDPEIQAVLYQ